MTTPSTPVSQQLETARQKTSGFHKAANASVVCLAVPFVMNALLCSLIFHELLVGRARYVAVISFLTIALYISAVVCGVIALCGIRKYGKKGLLWKGLVGVLLPICLVLAAIPMINHLNR